MFEKVNPAHPDKLADRIAGAIVDLAYKQAKDPRVAAEVLLGHGNCYIIVETDADLDECDITDAVWRIAGTLDTHIVLVPQDTHLSDNQKGEIRCGDNGIFKGVPTNEEEMHLAEVARTIYKKYPYDGKYIVDDGAIKTVCQSNAPTKWLQSLLPEAKVNPLGDWTGGTDVDAGATNRKLGSDMGRAVTGGGLHGKDLSKADVSVNIYAHLKAQETGKEIELRCAIGDTEVDGKPYAEIVDIARDYIKSVGGFERFAEWGLI